MTAASRAAPGAVVLPRPSRRAVIRLRRGQRHAPFRRVIGPVGFRRAWLTGVTVVVAVATATLAGLGRWASLHTTPATYAAGVALASLVAAAVLLRRALSAQARARVTAPHDVGLLRALDVRAPDVFVVDAGRQVVAGHLALLGAQTALLLAGGREVLGAWWLVLVPPGSCVLALGLAARRCASPRTSRPGLGSLALAAALAAVAGLAAGRGLEALLARGSLSVPPTVATTLLAAAAGAGGLAIAVGAVLGALAWRRLAGLTWARDPAGVDRPPTPGSEYARMRAMVERSALAGSVLGIWRTVVLVAAFGGGIVTAGPELPPTVSSVVGPLLTGYAFVTVLVASGVVLSVVGPSAMLPRFRFQWEISALSASRVAARGLAYPLAVVAVPSALLAGAQSALAAHLSVRTLALAIALVGSAVLAESVLPVAHHADGTITHHPLTAWVVLIVSAPAAAMPAGAVGSLLSMGCALTCLGAGHRCLTRRILRLPSSSVA